MDSDTFRITFSYTEEIEQDERINSELDLVQIVQRGMINQGFVTEDIEIEREAR